MRSWVIICFIFVLFGLGFHAAKSGSFSPKNVNLPVRVFSSHDLPQAFSHKMNPQGSAEKLSHDLERKPLADNADLGAASHLVLDPRTREAHTKNLEFMGELSRYNFLSFNGIDELGVNEQGSSEYEYQTQDGGRVHQWYAEDGFLKVETISLASGANLTRRYFTESNRVQEVTYEEANSYRRMWYTEDGNYEALEAGRDKSETVLYRYNDQMNVREIWNFNGEWTQAL